MDVNPAYFHKSRLRSGLGMRQGSTYFAIHTEVSHVVLEGVWFRTHRCVPPCKYTKLTEPWPLDISYDRAEATPRGKLRID